LEREEPIRGDKMKQFIRCHNGQCEEILIDEDGFVISEVDEEEIF